MSIVPKPDGFETSRTISAASISTGTRCSSDRQYPWVRTEIPYPVSIGGGSFRIVGLPTPIDRNDVFLGLPLTQDIRLERDLCASLQEPPWPSSDSWVERSHHARGHPAGGSAAGKLLQVDIASPACGAWRTEANRLFEGRKRPEAAE